MRHTPRLGFEILESRTPLTADFGLNGVELFDSPQIPTPEPPADEELEPGSNAIQIEPAFEPDGPLDSDFVAPIAVDVRDRVFEDSRELNDVLFDRDRFATSASVEQTSLEVRQIVFSPSSIEDLIGSVDEAGDESVPLDEITDLLLEV